MPATNITVPATSTHIFPFHEADKCVMCGLCLKVCPTYGLNHHEGESPRGRLSLLIGLAQGALDANPALVGHIDRCLGCHACEVSCPSGVPFIQLLDSGRSLIEGLRPRRQARFRRWLLSSLAIKPKRIKFLAWGIWLLQKSGLRGLARRSGLLKGIGLTHLDALLPTLSTPIHLNPFYPAQGDEQDQVALFHGCIAHAVDQQTIQSAIRLLNRLGVSVHIPRDQGCCGALHQHNGAPDEAFELAQTNLKAFTQHKIDTLLFLATGCGNQLQSHLTAAQAKAESVNTPIHILEVCQYLARIAQKKRVRFAPYTKRVAVHEPCTQKLIPGLTLAIDELLGRVPEFQRERLAGSEQCCGAGGGNLISQPKLSAQFRDAQARHIEKQAPDLILTTNIGCALQLQAGQRIRKQPIEVMHPVVLLEQLCR